MKPDETDVIAAALLLTWFVGVAVMGGWLIWLAIK